MSSPALHGRYDAVIVGGGHNGLVAAAYLARSGLSVLLLERLGATGGAASSEEPFAGLPVKVSPYAHDLSLLPDRIAKDLDLDLALRPRRTRSFTPVFRNKRHSGLLIESDTTSATSESFRSLTGLDREFNAWRSLQHELAELARAVVPTLLEPLRKERQTRELLRPETWQAFVEEPLGYTLKQRFRDDLVHGLVASDAFFGGPSDLYDSSLVSNVSFLYHHLGIQTGPQRVPVGGMGAFAGAVEREVWRSGGEIVTGAFVTGIESDAVRAQVSFRHGGQTHQIESTWVLGNVAPWVMRILMGEQPGPRPEGSHLQVTMLLDRLPRLTSGVPASTAFGGALSIGTGFDQLAQSRDEAGQGQIPEMPPARVYCNSLLDPSVLGTTAMDGKHLFTLQGYLAPARLFSGDVESQRDETVLRMIDALNVHLEEPIEGLVSSDVNGDPCLQALAPQDVESRLAMPGGHWFHGPLSWPWAPQDAALETPAQRWGVMTPWPKVLLCGAGAKRGAGVTGVGGHNAAMAVMEAMRRPLPGRA